MMSNRIISAINAVHPCLFCPQTFASATEKDDHHILEHFVQETCGYCNQKLIRIGSNWYTLHNAVTCNKNACQPIQPVENQHYIPNARKQQQKVSIENVQIKPEPYEAITRKVNQQLETESEIVIKPTLLNVQVDIIEDESYLECIQQFLGNRSENESKQSVEKIVNDKNRAECDICGKVMSFKSISNHKKLKHTAPGTHICRNCRKVFPNEAELLTHKTECRMNRKNQKWYKKALHNKQTHQQNEQQQQQQQQHHHNHQPHIQLNHYQQREKDAACDICGQLMSFKSISNHKKLKHTAPGTPICKICRKVFPNDVELSKHKLECLMKRRNPNCYRISEY